MAKGLDCGTSFYIAATEDTIKKQRNAFLTVDGEVTQVKRMLKRQGIPYVEKNKKIRSTCFQLCSDIQHSRVETTYEKWFVKPNRKG